MTTDLFSVAHESGGAAPRSSESTSPTFPLSEKGP